MTKKNSEIVNPADVKKLIATDKIFGTIHKQYGVPPNGTRPQGFVSLSKMILEQQVSLASANAHFRKLNSYIKEFTPENIIKLSEEEMRSCQISRQKSGYLRGLSNAILSGTLDLDSMSSLHEDEIRKQLTSIKGIGNWTTDVYLLFCLKTKDIFPIGDIAIVNTVKELTNAVTREEILDVAEKWRPLRSLAVYFLWHYYLSKRKRTADFDFV